MFSASSPDWSFHIAELEGMKKGVSLCSDTRLLLFSPNFSRFSWVNDYLLCVFGSISKTLKWLFLFICFSNLWQFLLGNVSMELISLSFWKSLNSCYSYVFSALTWKGKFKQLWKCNQQKRSLKNHSVTRYETIISTVIYYAVMGNLKERVYVIRVSVKYIIILFKNKNYKRYEMAW